MIEKVIDILSHKSTTNLLGTMKTSLITNLYIFRMSFLSKLLIVHLICHYAVQLLTAAFINPEEMVSVGLHERVGDCNEMVPVETVLKV